MAKDFYTVVVADDEVELLDAVCEMIPWNKIGFQLAGRASNGWDALQLVEQLRPDLLLTDIHMNFISGISLAKQVRELQPMTQIVFLSGYDDFEYAQKAIEYNVIRYLLKPITMEDLTRELEAVHDRIEDIFRRLQPRKQQGTGWQTVLLSGLLDGFGDGPTQQELLREGLISGGDSQMKVLAVESQNDISYTGNAQAVDEAVEAGIKVVVIDSDVASDGVSARIGTDNVEAGRIACRTALNTEEPVLNVGIINFDAGVRNGQERESGFREELYQDKRVRQIYTINVLTTVEEAERQTRVLLTAHPEINVLVSFNEPLAVGAARAVDNLHLEDQVRLVCFDSTLECIDKMQQGIVSALIVQNPYAMGYLGVETACKIINGRYQENGEFLTTPAVVVTKDNMFSLEGQKVLFPFG